MDAHQFLTEVQADADLPDRDTAERATRATLATLGERITGGEATDLAAQLPTELADALVPGTEAASFGLDEFVARVARRSELDEARAMRVAQCVMATVARAVTGGELDDLVAQLPNEYAPLLTMTGGTSDPP